MPTTDFTTRAKITTTAVARLRRWRSRDGRLAIVEIQSRFGLPKRYLVIRKLQNGNEQILSRHRNHKAAHRAARRHAARHDR